VSLRPAASRRGTVPSMLPNAGAHGPATSDVRDRRAAAPAHGRGGVQAAFSAPRSRLRELSSRVASRREERAMIDLYTWTTPNGRRASIMREESGLPYTVHPVNLSAEQQFSPEFTAITPNQKIPAIVDRDAPGGPLPPSGSGA